MIKAIADRPWIWIIVGCAGMIAVMVAVIIISIKHPQAEVPVIHQRGDY
jgi:bacteriorhodopsin